MTTLGAAECVAASLCWLSRMRTPAYNAIAARQVEGYWHVSTCRWCSIDRAELMAQIVATWADPAFDKAVAAFDRLSGPAKVARVKEAQERAWFDQLPSTGRVG